MVFKNKKLTNNLYRIDLISTHKDKHRIKSKCLECMKEVKNRLLKHKGVLSWCFFGVAVYGLPAAYRYITGIEEIQIFPFNKSPSKFIPFNLLEKFVVNPVFPGGVGAALGGERIANRYGYGKYVSRVVGSLTATGIWTGIQYLGHFACDILKYNWPSGGNPFEPPEWYPFNLLIAVTLAPLVPYAVDYVKSKIKK